MLRDGTCLSVTGHFAPFKAVGAYHLRALLRAEGINDSLDAKAASILGEGPLSSTSLFVDQVSKLVPAGVKQSLLSVRNSEAMAGVEHGVLSPSLTYAQRRSVR